MAVDTIIILYALAGMLFLQLAMQAADDEMKQAMGQYTGVFMIVVMIIILIWPLWMVIDVSRFIKGKLEK